MEEIKKELQNILEFIDWQLNNGKCTDAEIKSWHKMLSENIHMDATIGDMAEHFGQTENNVRNVINRRMPGKPKRRVLYNFLTFLKIAPKSWK